LRATDESTNPLIISIGHRISLDTALDCVKALTGKYRVPEPIRQADLRSR
jgi:deoxyribonuclease V